MIAKGTDLLEIVGFQGIDLYLGLLVLAGYSFDALTQNPPKQLQTKRATVHTDGCPFQGS
jgi:hypothetical protein